MTTNMQNNSWKSKSGYVWAMIGSAVGFANILGFGAKAYQNGGGAFLIPLGLAATILGIPLLILEGLIGKTFKMPLVSAYGMILGKWGKFIGWSTVFGVLTIGAYYCILNTWTLMYLFFSGTRSIPEDTQAFFNSKILLNSVSEYDFSRFSTPIALISVLLLFFTYKVCAKNINEGIETLCKVFLPVLFCIILFFLVCVSFLPGAFEGIKQFITPNFSQLMNIDVWIMAFGHIFFSFSVGLAIISGYSQYTSKDVNIVKSMIWVAIGDIATSIISGLVIFGSLGYISHYSDQPFQEVVSTSIFGLGFIVFPRILHTIPPMISQIIGPLFFFSLFIAGFSGLISIVEAVVGNIERELNWSRRFATKICISFIAAIALLFCFGNGAYLINIIDEMTSGINVLISGLLQIFCFLYISKSIPMAEEWKIKGKKAYFYYSLKFISPLFLLFILFSQISREYTKWGSLEVTIRWGWLTLTLICSLLLINKSKFVNVYIKYQGTLKDLFISK